MCRAGVYKYYLCLLPDPNAKKYRSYQKIADLRVTTLSNSMPDSLNLKGSMYNSCQVLDNFLNRTLKTY